jgi:hypothetical protein
LSAAVACSIDGAPTYAVPNESSGDMRAAQQILKETLMDELNGRLIACQILITGLIARVANDSRDPLAFLTDFRDEVKAVVNGIHIEGLNDSAHVRAIAQKTMDELFSLMKAPSAE